MAQLSGLSLQLAINFSEQIKDTDLWSQKSESLFHVASLLRDQLETHWSKILESKGKVLGPPGMGDLQATYFMIVGFAIENLCKGELIRKNSEDLLNQMLKKLPKYVSTHDLEFLLEKMKFPFDGDDDRELLARLTRCSIWAGRYPVPANSDGMANVREFESGRLLLARFSSEDLGRIDELVHRVQRHAGRRPGV